MITEEDRNAIKKLVSEYEQGQRSTEEFVSGVKPHLGDAEAFYVILNSESHKLEVIFDIDAEIIEVPLVTSEYVKLVDLGIIEV